jgi:hypothetical protein
VGVDDGTAETAASAYKLGVLAPEVGDGIGLLGAVFEDAAATTALGGSENLEHGLPPIGALKIAHMFALSGLRHGQSGSSAEVTKAQQGRIRDIATD